MKKVLLLLLVLVLSFSLVLTGCGGGNDAPAETPAEDTVEPLKIVLLLNGTLGDKSFFDSANNGMQLVKDAYGDEVEVKTIEMGYDETKWEPTLLDIAEEDWDIVVVGTWQMTEYLQDVASENHDKKFFIFDTAVNYDEFDLPNVYSILYNQNEGSFLAGALAAKVTTSDMELANADKMIGFLGGMDIPVINDFLVGYIEGALYVDPEMKVLVSYIGSFDDSAKGKEMALAQYRAGADIGFNVAGQAGLGQLDAAKEEGKYAIGVDSDQAGIFLESDPDKAALITTSMLKRVDNSLLRAVDMHVAGTLVYGAAENLGIAEEAIGLAQNDIYMNLISDEIRAEIEDIAGMILSGDIAVSSAFGMTSDELAELKNSVQ